MARQIGWQWVIARVEKKKCIAREGTERRGRRDTHNIGDFGSSVMRQSRSEEVENVAGFRQERIVQGPPLGHCTRDSAKDLSQRQRLQSLGRFAALVSKGVTESRAATKRYGDGWPESRNYEYGRTSWGANATGSGVGIHRAIESAISVRCDGRNHASGK